MRRNDVSNDDGSRLGELGQPTRLHEADDAKLLGRHPTLLGSKRNFGFCNIYSLGDFVGCGHKVALEERELVYVRVLF